MHLTWDRLQALSEIHGDSFYILEPDRFRANFRDLQDAFRRHYSATWIAYSYKTNYTPRVCRLVEELGGFAEVVSEMELELALRLGIAGAKIVYNGPMKAPESIARCLLEGGLVNVDALEDVAIVERLASSHPDACLRVGIRCNFEVGEEEVSRFGIDIHGPDFSAAIKRLRACANVRLEGLHCHFPFRKLETYPARIATLLQLAAEHFPEGPQFLDIGGGYFGKMGSALQAQFKFAVPDYTAYADVLAVPMAKAYGHLPADRRPRLLLEPGTAVVADAMHFVARVKTRKTVRGKHIAVLAGSKFNVSPTASHLNLPFEAFHAPSSLSVDAAGPVDLSGYTCIENDYLARSHPGPLAQGDFVAFSNVGSYSVVMKPPFILPNRPVLEYQALTDTFQIIKRAETFQDLFASFKL